MPDPIAPPELPADPNQLALCKMLLAETMTPWRPAYDERLAAISMLAMRATVQNRLTRPEQFRAKGATTWIGILGAPRQFDGFSRKGDDVVIAPTVQARIDEILRTTTRPESIGARMRAFVQLAIDTARAQANTDPFADLREIAIGNVTVPVLGGTWGWRTVGSDGPGGRLVAIPAFVRKELPSGVLLRNQFYALRA